MTLSSTPVDRENTAPFLIKVFYRTGALLRTEELLAEPLPPHKQIYAWRDTTLSEIADDLSFSTSPEILPYPIIGTRLEFSHVFQAPPGPQYAYRSSVIRAAAGGDGPPLIFTRRDIGSIVFGAGGPGASEAEGWDGVSHDSKSIQDIRFVQGDMLICAIMPPDEEKGDVVPARTARVGRGKGIGEAGGDLHDYGGNELPPRSGRGYARRTNARTFGSSRNSHHQPRWENVSEPRTRWPRGEIPDSGDR